MTGTSGPKLIGMTSPGLRLARVESGTTGSARTERIGNDTPITARVRPLRHLGSGSALSSTLPVSAPPCGFIAATG